MIVLQYIEKKCLKMFKERYGLGGSKRNEMNLVSQQVSEGEVTEKQDTIGLRTHGNEL